MIDLLNVVWKYKFNGGKKKKKITVSLGWSRNQFCGKPVGNKVLSILGGITEYHKSNRKLFNTSTISLMLNKTAFPLHFIEEFSGENKLFKIKRSNGSEQLASLCENASMFWSESKSTNLESKWRIQMCFYDLSNMSDEEIKDSNMKLKESGDGDFVKTLFLTDIVKLNELDCITLQLTKLKMSLRETDINEDYEERYGIGYESDSDSSVETIEINESFINSSEKLFIDRDNQPDIILNNYHSVITEGVINYFEKRLDEYIIAVKNSLSSEGIKVIVK